MASVIIRGTIEGEFTDKLKREYAKALARILIAEYGKETCKKILEELKKDNS
ncbi:hypothetical protein CPJCM30710_25310 [Clostridium polyendosporum]|uniref:Uncharacterized protein n=1 Tax=Clostridium polyendosporum TaxID=69208 RepID=A0A919VGZ0_9CLOT|nr:hypothetical protein [Clostridium polyendosporum]GIM29865.1 hypothetical protein CPJCM30710_25310 [Clostridium polyendosporum]